MANLRQPNVTLLQSSAKTEPTLTRALETTATVYGLQQKETVSSHLTTQFRMPNLYSQTITNNCQPRKPSKPLEGVGYQPQAHTEQSHAYGPVKPEVMF